MQWLTDGRLSGQTDRPCGGSVGKCVPVASGAETYRGSGNAVSVVKMQIVTTSSGLGLRSTASC